MAHNFISVACVCARGWGVARMQAQYTGDNSYDALPDKDKGQYSALNVSYSMPCCVIIGRVLYSKGSGEAAECGVDILDNKHFAHNFTTHWPQRISKASTAICDSGSDKLSEQLPTEDGHAGRVPSIHSKGTAYVC